MIERVRVTILLCLLCHASGVNQLSVCLFVVVTETTLQYALNYDHTYNIHVLHTEIENNTAAGMDGLHLIAHTQSHFLLCAAVGSAEPKLQHSAHRGHGEMTSH